MNTKRNMITTILAAVLSGTALAQNSVFFEPYKQTELRMPAVPLVTSDPYLSIWSPYDKLNEGDTRHWTNDPKPLEGLLRVDGKIYRFMGAAERKILKPIVPMAADDAWEADYTMQTPADGWQRQDFIPSGWQHGKGAFGTDNNDYINTTWTGNDTHIYVRRTINVTAADLEKDLYLVFSHDDAMELYINGTQVATGIMDWVEGVTVKLTAEQKKLLKPGKNVMAAHCYNKTGGALVDFGLFENVFRDNDRIMQAKQKSCSVMATSTYYTFACGPVDLDVVFTAPMLIDDYDLLSAPANYVSYRVKSNDKKAHDVQFYLSATPQMAVNKTSQPTVSTVIREEGLNILKSGTIDQPILASKGDGICIDWGYFCMPAVNGSISLSTEAAIKQAFVDEGTLPQSQKEMKCYKASEMPTMAYVHDFGTTKSGESYTLLGYDEIQDIEYMYHRYQAYWAHNGKVTMAAMLRRLKEGYADIMMRCREMDKRIYDDAMKSGGKKYAEVLSGAYRQVIAAHKLFEDKDGKLLFFSKENNSNGCVNTVDLTYPSAPLFLVYNPDLEKGMITSILDYSKSGRWTKPFAAHDIGTYPIANGQVYGGDMPLEEAGNIITLVAMICQMEGNTQYADPYWDVFTTWVDYLVENGQDPENQLCTDDFAGHWAHNCNLAVKAIMGVTGYAMLAQMKGDAVTANKYMTKARQMGAKWESDAREGDHYKLAFDREGTWSQKYNMVWDKIWGTQIFPNNAIEREIKYYLNKQNPYGLPLDNRKQYTKTDWIMWTAAMADSQADFLKLTDPVYKYFNETTSRVPMNDWSNTDEPTMVGFKARSVIGGYWMKVLVDKLAENK